MHVDDSERNVSGQGARLPLTSTICNTFVWCVPHVSKLDRLMCTMRVVRAIQITSDFGHRNRNCLVV